MISSKIQNLNFNIVNLISTTKYPVFSLNLHQNFKKTYLTTFNHRNKVKDREQIFIHKRIFLQREYVHNKIRLNNMRKIQDNLRRQIKNKTNQ